MPDPSLPLHPVEGGQTPFESLGLAPELVQAARELGWSRPTPIQARVIPPALSGADLVGIAETGSGKTGAFVLPLCQRIEAGRPTQALILSPTREIALQTKAFLDYFGASRHLRAAALVGGLEIRHQLRTLSRGPELVVATPGRLLDHLERGSLTVGAVSELVLDEADHMLDLGFLPQLQRILRALPSNRHTLMFSATMPDPIRRLAERWMRAPATVDLTPPGRTAAGLTHRLYLVDVDNKRPCVIALLGSELGPTVVFVRRRTDAEFLFRQLARSGHPVERLHADMTQSERLRALASFRDGHHRILIATNVAARGLDIPAIRHVVHYDLPDTVEEYIHRSGRTARGDSTGLVSIVATWLDREMVRSIERALGQPLPRCTVPGVEPYRELAPRRTLSRRRLR